MRHRTRIYLHLFLLIFSGFCHGQVLLADSGRSVFVGSEISVFSTPRDMPVEEMLMQADFKPLKGNLLNRVGGENNIWVRISVRNQTSQRHLLLHLAAPTVESVTLFAPAGDDKTGFRSQTISRSRPFAARKYNTPAPVFDIYPAPNTTQTYYLKLRSELPVFLPVYINPPAVQFKQFGMLNTLSALYAGVIVIMFFYNLFLYFSIGSRSYFYYVIYVLFIGLTQLSVDGFAFQYLWPDWPALGMISIPLFASVSGIAALLFAKHFLNVRRFAPRALPFFSIFIGIFLVSLLLIVLGARGWSFWVMQINTAASCLFGFVLSLYIMRKGFPPARFFFIGWSILILGSIIFVSKDYGWLPYNRFTSFVMELASIIELALLSFGLANLINHLKREKAASQQLALKMAQENELILKNQNVLLDQKVKKRTSELLEKNTTLTKTLADLKQTQSMLVSSEKMAALGQLTAGVAHEINNPINFVASNVAPLKRDIGILLQLIAEIEALNDSAGSRQAFHQEVARLKEEQDFDYLRQEIDFLLNGIQEGAGRTATIVKSLRTFSRVDEEEQKYAQINEGLQSTLVIANNLLADIEVQCAFGDIPLISCYPGKLNQVFLNMISNAAFAIKQRFGTQPGGILKIGTSETDHDIVVSICDNGSGMDKDTLDQIFEPFFTTKEVGEGTGLGMSIAFAIVQKHQGRIEVRSRRGAGSEFLIYLRKPQRSA